MAHVALSGQDFAGLRRAFAGKRVLVTGHTGFKGSWLTVWLGELGAQVFGFSLAPDTRPSMFEDAGLAELCRHAVGDLRALDVLASALEEASPDVVFHLAAQPLVRESYERPLETIQTNVLGTAHLLELIRRRQRPVTVVVVTSDKAYENREQLWGYREDDAVGGHDVYSMSKGAAELVAQSYRRSFFDPARLDAHGVAVCTARAGNVVGGGDWAKDRIVPDLIRALLEGRPVELRNPQSIRPWQHVLEPLGGYLLLAARLELARGAERARLCEAFNFGPQLESTRTVAELVERVFFHWGGGEWKQRPDPAAPHEARVLRLAIDKAFSVLGWQPTWSFDEALRRTVQWYRHWQGGARGAALRDFTARQIRDFEEAKR